MLNSGQSPITGCATHVFLDDGWPAFIQHRTALCVVDLEPQREANWTDVVCRVLSKTETRVGDACVCSVGGGVVCFEKGRCVTVKLAGVCDDTHVDMEGHFVAESLSCANPHRQLGLSVRAVVKQGPR